MKFNKNLLYAILFVLFFFILKLIFSSNVYILSTINYLASIFCFIIFFIFLSKSWPKIKSTLKISKKHLAILILIFILVFGIKVFSNHNIMVITDEPKLLNVAHNIAFYQNSLVCEPALIEESCIATDYHVSWASLFAVIFLMFGESLNIAFIFTSFFTSLTVFFIFFISLLLFKNTKIAFLSVIILSFEKIFFAFSLSTSVSASGVTFFLLNILLFLIYFLDLKDRNIPFMFYSSFLLLILARFEGIVVLPIYICYLLISKKYNFLSWLAYPVLLVSFIVVKLTIFTVQSFDGSVGLSLQNIILNFFDAVKILSKLNYLIILFAIIILSLIFIRKNNFKEVLFLLAIFAASFITIIAGNYFKGQERYFISFIPIVAILASFIILRIISLLSNHFSEKILLFLVIILVLVFFLPHSFTSMTDASNIFTRYDSVILQYDDGCLFVCEEPLLFDYFDRFESSNLNNFSKNPEVFSQDCIYFIHDGYCESRGTCNLIMDNYKYKKTNNTEINLYRLYSK